MAEELLMIEVPQGAQNGQEPHALGIFFEVGGQGARVPSRCPVVDVDKTVRLLIHLFKLLYVPACRLYSRQIARCIWEATQDQPVSSYSQS